MNTRLQDFFAKLTLIALLLAPALCLANPEGGVVSAGEASIQESGQSLTINQVSDKAVIDWRSFDIAPNETTKFNQPSPESVTLNRIHSDHASTIAGKLSANGNIVLVNQNGFLFTKDAVVDVNSIIATTSDIDNTDFMTGKMEFNKPGNPDAMIINEGSITAKEAGLVGMVAPQVINNGHIVANGGTVQLSSGDSFTVDLYGDKLMEVAVSDKLRKQLVKNKGLIEAKGGKIILTAAAGKEIVDSLIVVEGELKAPAVMEKSGEIYIYAEESVIDATGFDGLTETTEGLEVFAERIGSAGGDIRIGGDYRGEGNTPAALNLLVESESNTITDSLNSGDAGRSIFWADNIAIVGGAHSARAFGENGNGGFIETSGHRDLQIDDNIKIMTKAENGILGTWLLDPGDITITAATNFQVTGATPFTVNGAGAPTLSAATIVAALNTPTNVIIQTSNDAYSTNGDIIVGSPITATGTGSLTLLAFRDIQINSAISLAGGNLTLTAANNYNAGADTNRGSVVVNAAISTTGTGNITLSGYGTTTGASTNGIKIVNTVSTGTGNITLTGWGINAGSGLDITKTISTNSPGAINITGKNIVSANNAAPSGQGVSMCCGTVASGTSNITITGQGTGNSDTYLEDAYLIQNSGTITIQAQCSLTAVACGGIDFAQGGTIHGNLIVNAGATGTFSNNAFALASSGGTSLAISAGTFSLNVANTPDFGSVGKPFSTVTLNQTAGNLALDVNVYATSDVNINAPAGGINLSGTYQSTGGSVNFSPSTNIITLNSNGFSNAGVTTISAASSVTLPTTIVGTTNGVESLSVTGSTITMPATIGSSVGPIYLSSASLNTKGAASTISLPSIYANTINASTSGATANITTSGAYTIYGNTTLTATNAAVSLNAGGVSGNFNFIANSYSALSLPVISTKSITATTTGAGADITTSGTQTAATGVISFSSYRNITISNTLTTTNQAITLTSNNAASGSGAIAVNANISSGGGNITMTGGSGYAFGYSGNETGVTINANINSGSGSIVANGKSYQGASAVAQNGVIVTTGLSLTATGSGNIMLWGKSNPNTTAAFNQGISLDKAAISVVNGTITMTGDTGYSSGLYLNGSISATSGNILINGTAAGTGASSNSNYGIWSAGGTISSTTGNITMTGSGGGSNPDVTGSNFGIYIQAAISSSGGAISLTGTGGLTSSGSNNHGIYVNSGSISAAGGSINYDGTGGGGSFAQGIALNTASITATGAGQISLTGTGGNSTGNWNAGIHTGGSTISSVNGNITLTGTGGGAVTSGANNFGIYHNGTISSTNGTISLTGTAGLYGALSVGVYLENTHSTSTTGTGSISIIGAGATNGSGSADGVHFNGGGTLSTIGTGTININGTASNLATGNNSGVNILAGSVINSSGNTTTITGQYGFGGDDIYLNQNISTTGITNLVSSCAPCGVIYVNNAYTVAGNMVINAGATGTFQTNSTLDGNKTLGITAATITPNGAWGGGTPLGVLALAKNISTTGAISASTTAGNISLGATFTSSAGAVTLSPSTSAIVLSAATTVSASTIAGLGGTVNGAFPLTVSAATVTPNGAWGGTTPLSSITFNTGFTLGADLNATSSGTTNITSTVDGTTNFTSTVDGGFNLNITSNAITQGGIIGGGTPLTSATLNSAIAMTLPFNISTSGAIFAETTAGNITTSANYTSSAGSVTISPAGVAEMILAADTTINAPTITIPTAIDGTVNYNESLTLISTGTITLGGAIGGSVPLKDVSITAGNTITIPAITANSIFVQTTGAAANIITGGNLNTGATNGTGLIPAATIGAANVTDFSYGVFLYPGLDLDNSGNYIITNLAATYWAVMTGDSAITNIIKGGLVAPQYLGCSYANPITCSTPALAAFNNQNAFLFGASTIPVTISGTSIINKVYDGTNLAYLNLGSLVGVLPADAANVILIENGSYAQVGVGNGITVFMSASLSGSAASSYTLTQPGNLIGNIYPRPLTVTGTVASDKVYDSTTSATISSGILNNVVAGETLFLAQGGDLCE
ncbi:unnamed protein product [Sphagnum jensenii]